MMGRLSSWMFCFYGLVFPLLAGAQERPEEIAPIVIEAGYDMTTHLLFPYGIESVDIGSKGVIARKAQGMKNILLVKAANRSFGKTSLSVVTEDGKYYAFTVGYAEAPTVLHYSFGGAGEGVGVGPDKATLERAGALVLGSPANSGVQRVRQGLRLRVRGVYLAAGQLWFKLELANRSALDFTGSYMRFFLQDKKQTKRTARQQRELFPVYREGEVIVSGHERITHLVCFAPFMVPSHQRLLIQVGDAGGGRMVELRIPGRVLLQLQKLQ